MTQRTPDPISPTTPDSPGVLFARTREDFLAARIGDYAFAMLPGHSGRYYFASAWLLYKPMEEWAHADFYSRSGEVADEAAFRARVAESAEHLRQRAALGRREIHSTANTPWGASQGATVYADGVVCHSTAGHGGFHLDAAHNAKVHPALRTRGGWYEEDSAWAAVAQAFPELFTDYERHHAEQTIRDWYPDVWEAIHGRSLLPGESHEKDRRTFERDHAADWIVVSAITSEHRKGFVEVVATLGGKRGPGTEERRFLVPADEYQVGRFGFVIDETRHSLYGGLSSFVGWQP
ncbi:hypothetical protein OCA5_pHCG300940 (plasmid) [Afipia carboxidovorans OM5]|uniref:DUF7007 domain-containing protein n=1 Tax=Afipia carboxidovorans (strain ATCC 49405 / DSM 1227 / KCTC 32145 / OM5) TaxID=504832 RepID=F8C157_AFIC5|nr:hypothetical protein [Afipia carboxidovorans]AEI04539.1 hypothetical protein OCA4_pHCG3B00940 [Afipia carboxidovorans OM4]AEI08167.1 hypothetical protein OCA5_pHCG300940 [Afipia carboxidovorans OM5]